MTVNTSDDTRVRSARPLGAKARKNAERSRGQILILFVMAIFVFVGMVAIVIDISWYWVNSLRVQRAADAAALAGVVQLPTNPTSATGAFALARAEAKKNGYDDAAATITVTPVQDPPTTGRRLVVTVSAPVDMFFMRIFGINSIMATRTSKAEFVLPVPMGSPQNWYGVFGPIRNQRQNTTTTAPAYSTHDGPRSSGFKVATTSPFPLTPVWTKSSGTLISAVNANDSVYARTNTDGASQDWGNFDLLSGLASDETATLVKGLQVELTDVHLSASCTGTTNTIRVSLSYDAGAHWSAPIAAQLTPNLGTSTTAGDYSFGTTTSTAPWQTFNPPATPAAHTWIGDDLGNSNFRLRLTANKACGTSGTLLNVDRIRVQATYNYDTLHPPVTTTVTTDLGDPPLKAPGTPCTAVANCYQPNGVDLAPNGFWGTMNTEGAITVNGDAYQPWWNTSGSATNPNYNAIDFYNYAVEMPAGTTNGSVYVFDPVFCATQVDSGTADRWFGGTGTPVSSFFELYDTQGTQYDPFDDTLVVSSGNLFRNVDGSDTLMQATATNPNPTLLSGASECLHSTTSTYGDARDYHNEWFLLASGLSGGPNGKVYRVHTTSTDPANISAQQYVNGENSFALYANASGGTPRIYGIGAMQAFTPLSSSSTSVDTVSEFYLAQIEAVHAGKSVEIKLWDPGDTNPLRAELQILTPNPTGWSPTNLTWTAASGTPGSASCGASTWGSGSSIVTNVGATGGTYNGCWLTITIPIPAGYTADQDGWWKIRYKMRNSGSGTDTSSDVTTWKVEIRGNPVHLIVP